MGSGQGSRAATQIALGRYSYRINREKLMAINTKQPFASRQKPPRSSGAIDGAKIDDSNEASIENDASIPTPSTDMHATTPGPGNEAAGQTSKM